MEEILKLENSHLAITKIDSGKNLQWVLTLIVKF